MQFDRDFDTKGEFKGEDFTELDFTFEERELEQYFSETMSQLMRLDSTLQLSQNAYTPHKYKVNRYLSLDEIVVLTGADPEQVEDKNIKHAPSEFNSEYL